MCDLFHCTAPVLAVWSSTPHNLLTANVLTCLSRHWSWRRAVKSPLLTIKHVAGITLVAPGGALGCSLCKVCLIPVVCPIATDRRD